MSRDKYALKSWLCLTPIILLIQAWLPESAWAYKKCVNNPAGVAKLIEIRPGFHRVSGVLADFDPCHPSVTLSMPSFFANKLSEKPPLLIIAHGGNGPGAAENEMARRMNSKGVATLLFDAYNLNGFEYRGSNLFLTGMSNESRQRMILKVTYGAYNWAKTLNQIDNTRIFIYGLSNGGSVALNMAALVEPEHVKAVFAEGASPTGIGMPDQIKVALYLAYGKIDNYGGKTEDDWMYSRTDSCSFNEISPIASIGTAHRCNRMINSEKMTISPLSWANTLKKDGQPIHLWFYENAAHGLLAGYINRDMRTYGTGPSAILRFGWTGADPDTAHQFVKDMLTVITESYK